MFRVEVAVPPGAGVTGLSLNDPPTPLTPEIESVTGDAKLLRELTVTPRLAEEPWTMTRLEDVSPMEKSPEYSIKAHEFAWHEPSA